MRFDIMPLNSPHGGHTRIDWYKGGANLTYVGGNNTLTSWREGELVLVDASSGLMLGASSATAHTVNTGLFGIAAASTEAILRGARVTSGTATSALMFPMYPFQPDQEFITPYMGTTGTLTTPTFASGCGLYRTSTAIGTGDYGVNGRYSINDGGAGIMITRLLDSRKRDTAITGGTAVYAVFRAIFA